MKACDVMTRSVTTIREEASITEALNAMLGKAISGLPVVDQKGQLVGIITEGDLLRRAEMATEKHVRRWQNLLFGPWFSAREYVRSHARSVGSVMTREVLCIEEDTPLQRIVETMEQGHVKRLPVVKDGQVIGIVGRRDLLKPLSALIDDPLIGVASDEEIVSLIKAELAGQAWNPGRLNLEIDVSHGTVALKARVYGDEEAQAQRVVAENTPGVNDVRVVAVSGRDQL